MFDACIHRIDLKRLSKISITLLKLFLRVGIKVINYLIFLTWFIYSNYSNKTSVNSLNSLISNISHSKTDIKKKKSKELNVKEHVYQISNDELSQNIYRTDSVNINNENMIFDEEKSYFSYDDKTEEGFYLDR